MLRELPQVASLVPLRPRPMILAAVLAVASSPQCRLPLCSQLARRLPQRPALTWLLLLLAGAAFVRSLLWPLEELVSLASKGHHAMRFRSVDARPASVPPPRLDLHRRCSHSQLPVQQLRVRHCLQRRGEAMVAAAPRQARVSEARDPTYWRRLRPTLPLTHEQHQRRLVCLRRQLAEAWPPVPTVFH